MGLLLVLVVAGMTWLIIRGKPEDARFLGMVTLVVTGLFIVLVILAAMIGSAG